MFGKKYRIIAGENQKSTVVKEVENSDSEVEEEEKVEDTKDNNDLKAKKAVKINKELVDSSSESQSLDSEEEDDISMMDSAANQSEEGDLMDQVSTSPMKATRGVNIKHEIKRSLSFLFRFESDFQANKPNSNLNIPNSFKNTQ